MWAGDNVQRRIDGVCWKKEVLKSIIAELAKLHIQRTNVLIREEKLKLKEEEVEWMECEEV